MPGLPARSTHRILALGLAAGLLALGLPQSIDTAMRLYAAAELAETASTGALSAPPAERGIALLDAADRWFDDPAARIEAGAAAFRLAYPPGGEVDSAGMRQAISALSSGLSRRPADRRGWMYLAHAELAIGDTAAALQAFRTAILVAPYDPDLSAWRTELGVDLWPLFDADDRRLVADQIQIAWTAKPWDVLALAKTSVATAIIRLALASSPSALEKFEAKLGEQR
jgi:tetratricopeptide (TPR) repeat protein